MKNNKGSKDR